MDKKSSWPGKYFSREEFACKCGCGFDTVDAELLEVLDNLREMLKAKIKVISGCRCKTHNKKVNGAQKTGARPGSYHLYGKAADIKIKRVNSTDVAAFLRHRYPRKFGIGQYRSWVHIDVGPMRRWTDG